MAPQRASKPDGTKGLEMKVLIGVDGSLDSFAAVRLIARLLVADADEILLYYSPPHIELRTRTTLQPEVLDRVHHSLTDAVFDAAQEQLPNAMRTKTQTIIGTQKPAHGLMVAADEYRADMVVLGARGASTARVSGIGSVTRHVVHSSRLPVLVARPRTEETALLHILLACDGSECSRNAGSLLHKFKWPNDSVGRVMTVVESLVAGHIPEWLESELRDNEAESVGLGFFERSEQEEQHAREDLLRYFGELPAPFQGHDPIVSQGHAAQEILNTIEAEKTDLVVVGARGRGAFGRLFIGSTSEHVLTHAPCSVLIVREHERP
jgi:nucleotide-binding universal stress UspA family protein